VEIQNRAPIKIIVSHRFKVTSVQEEEEEEEEEERLYVLGGGGESLIKDLKREANSLSRDTRQARALDLEGGPPPLKNCSARHD